MNIDNKQYQSIFFVIVIWCLTHLLVFGIETEKNMVRNTYHSGDFQLVYKGNAADVYIEEDEYKLALIAASDFSEDIKRITGKKPQIKHSIKNLSQQTVFIGTIGKSPFINQLVQSGKLDIDQIKGKWESFVQAVVANPQPGIEKALVVIGSDRRGTAYGVYDLSEKIGISPWYWWADVTPKHKKSLLIRPGTYQQGPPAVKYRGIFVNDEMWGIRPWASKTFAPEETTPSPKTYEAKRYAVIKEGLGLGPKTYAKIFELLLRLKANYIWPAMHRGTKPFNFYPLNKRVADDYAMVMGSSHIEPMLRNNIAGGEWETVGCGPWNYSTNRDNIFQYWKDRIRTNGMYENIYTIGMRGKDDEAMKGIKTPEENINILEQIFSDQRAILEDEVNPDITKVPQLFIMYTEVLDLYNKGLRVPEDVIMCWPDDNFGYIRQLPGPAEKARPGGTGVYYHIQWLNGWTTAYTWLNTTPPALIWEEMSKSYDYNARKLWILNVGDIKPGEIGTEFFLRMAWDMSNWGQECVHDYLVKWAQRDIDHQYAEQIVSIMEKYYQLGYTRRPEHLVQLNKDRQLQYSWFSHINYNDEAQQRIKEYEKITQEAEIIYRSIPQERKDAFFQFVLYPVKCSSLMNKKIIYADKSIIYAKQGRSSAAQYAEKAKKAAIEIDHLTNHYNCGLITAGNKWEYFMALPGPWGDQWRQFEMPPLSDFNGDGPAQLGISLEGGKENELDDFSVYTHNQRFIDIFNKGHGKLIWKAEISDPWIKLSESSGELEKEKRIWVSIDWDTAPNGEKVKGKVSLTAKDILKTIIVKIFNPSSPHPAEIKGFVESHGYICMEAEHYTNKIHRGVAHWKVIKGLGRSGDSVAVYPTTTSSRTKVTDILKHSPVLEYDIYVFNPGLFSLTAYCIPTFRINPDRGIRFAVSIDNEKPEILTHHSNYGNRSIMQYPLPRDCVLENVIHLNSKHKIQTRGNHTLKIWMVDPGVIIDKLVLSTGQVKDSYSGPPESFHN